MTNVAEKTIAVQVHLGMPGHKPKVKDKSTIETEADKDRLHLHKDILVSKEFKRIKRMQGAIRNAVRSLAVPSPMLRGGIYQVPVGLIGKVKDLLETFRVEMYQWVEAFLAVYPELVVNDREKLGPLFDVTDYPDVEVLRAAFKFEVLYLNFETPEKLGGIDAVLFEEQKEKFAALWRQAEEATNQLLLTEMSKLVRHMVDRTSPKGDGKRKKFHKTLTTNIRDFFETFPFRNVNDNEELATLVGQAQKILDGVEIIDLKENATIRQAVNDGFAKVKANLDTMLKDAPVREFSFGDE